MLINFFGDDFWHLLSHWEAPLTCPVASGSGTTRVVASRERCSQSESEKGRLQTRGEAGRKGDSCRSWQETRSRKSHHPHSQFKLQNTDFLFPTVLHPSKLCFAGQGHVLRIGNIPLYLPKNVFISLLTVHLHMTFLQCESASNP